jgi:hypothetical protein
MVIDGLQVSFGFLEPQSVVLVLLRVHLLFALPLAGRRAISTLRLLLQLLVVLFRKLLDFPALSGTVAHVVVDRASGTSIVATRRLTRVFVVTSWATTPTCHCSSNRDSGSSG